ncbi:3-oxoacyl-[acyl-carrier-protein] reductase FabG [Phaeobacter sp. CECT 5382]|uniref:SDR family NAD(P)-dependent oxidoreductase n=1 Tax=Phaeobacter sp. CECT 5382 TaxID=1712645 RepID=UPI0006DABB0C|nr:SDR family NAD(P)-dependent oxidoreductase [Phaeobacter sp. CECT 5382]CUH88966.1 3-oxoacyl-[acyl-carrier-protein] reductase FabG [Phaeobacter sp. CECT 5382]
MNPLQGKTYWLVGASEGLGREIAKELVAAGAHVILSARSEVRLKDLAQTLGAARPLVMDVTDSHSVENAAKAVGSIDGVIYNAGAYEPMRSQEWDSGAAIAMLEVNFTGALRVLGHVVPQFVSKGQGDVTLIGSLAGYHGLPAAIGYGASKSALMSLAETMRHDLKGSGITVRIVNPGFIKTRLTDKNSFAMPQLMSAEMAAAHVLRAMKRRGFRTDFPRPFSWVIKILHLLPDWIVYRGK